MPDDETRVHVISIPDPLPAEEMTAVANAIRDAFDDAGVGDEAIVVNGSVDAIGRDELLTALQEDGDE